MEIVIAGDPKGGVAAFGALSDSADTFGGKLGKMSLAAGAAFAAVGATAGVALVKIGSDFQQGFRDIQVATGATGEALEALKADAKAVMSEVPDSFETVAQGIGILNTAFGESGEALQALSVQAIDASRILKEDAGANMKGLGKVANQFGLDAQGAGVLLDDLFKVTQDFGVGLGPLQEQLRNYGPIFQNIGFDASETSVIMGQFSKAGIDIAKVSPALNKFSRDVAAVGGDPMTALLDITQAINDAASTTDALNIASDAFGAEGAQRMVTAVRDAGVGFEDLQDALAGSEGGIALAAEQTATLGEKWREFTNKVLVQLEPVATRVFGFVMDAMDRLGPIAEQATAALAPFLEILGGSGSIGEKLSGLWTEAQPHLAEFKDRFVQW
ncbi:MAG: phage tail tape measure protein, partial [Planctomycetaceae bacterium]|nr:phage tail tape measure protein [Planctomycetaceae bacterium]